MSKAAQIFSRFPFKEGMEIQRDTSNDTSKIKRLYICPSSRDLNAHIQTFSTNNYSNNKILIRNELPLPLHLSILELLFKMASTLQASICNRQQRRYAFLQSSANRYESEQNHLFAIDAIPNYKRQHRLRSITPKAKLRMAPDLKIEDIDRRFKYRAGWPRLIHAPVETVWLSLGPEE